MVFTAYTMFYLFAAVVSAVAAAFAWRRRIAPGGIWLCLTASSASAWALAEALDYSSLTLSSHVLWGQLSYLGATTAPVFLFLFTCAYTGRYRWTRAPVVAALLVIPMLGTVAAFTNEYHHLVWPGFELIPGREYLIVYQHGPAYWAVTVYGLVLTLLASVQLIFIAIRARTLYRAQSLAVIIAVLIPWVAEIAYSVAPHPPAGFDPAITLAFTGTVLTFTMLRYKLLDVMPVPREVLVEEMIDGLLVLDHEARLLEINPVAVHLLGVTPGTPTGRPLWDILTDWPDAVAVILNTEGGHGHDARLSKDGRHLSVHRVSLSERRNGLRRDMYVLRDITEQVLAESALHDAIGRLCARMAEIEGLQAELQEQAIRDPLTGLHNRRYLAETLERELGRAAREGYPVSLVMIDVDHFKQVNDTLGHAGGDSVLRTLGAELRAHTRIGDIACRFGGDEFLVVLPNTSIELATQLAERWRMAWHEELRTFGEGTLGATLSIGVAAFPVHGTFSEGLVAAADSAVYGSKAAGRDRVSIAHTILTVPRWQDSALSECHRAG